MLLLDLLSTGEDPLSTSEVPGVKGLAQGPTSSKGQI